LLQQPPEEERKTDPIKQGRKENQSVTLGQVDFRGNGIFVRLSNLALGEKEVSQKKKRKTVSYDLSFSKT